ncbi:MAG: heavy-metal-associated domain-containing protein [Pseudobdellovibrio sp.]|nr:heavy-metal-associated domain-containing protein [Pseudobdellovibrio sp.]
MKKLFIATMLLASTVFAKPLTGEVHVKVKGMVCAFCAQGLTKTFKKMPEVEKVNVSLEEKFVHLVLKKDASLEDTKIIDAIKEAGYEGTIGN